MGDTIELIIMIFTVLVSVVTLGGFLRNDIKRVDKRVDDLKTDLKADIATVQADVGAVRSEVVRTRLELAESRKEMGERVARLETYMFGDLLRGRAARSRAGATGDEPDPLPQPSS